MGIHLEHIGLLDDMRELADIPRPIERGKLRERLRGGLPRLHPIAAGVLLGKKIDELGDVLGALPEGWDTQFDHVEAEVEILPERPLHHLGLEVAVGGGDDLDVDRHRLGRSDRMDLALLEDAEELRLEIGRHLADLIEKHHAPLGGAENADRLPVGPGEGPLLMAEQLAFRQRRRQGAAVDRHKRPGSTWPAAVEEAGEDLLAAAGLAEDQDRAADLGRSLDRSGHPGHRRIAPQHPFRSLELLPAVGLPVARRARLPGCALLGHGGGHPLPGGDRHRRGCRRTDSEPAVNGSVRLWGIVIHAYAPPG